jgi:hypothetical protein
MERRGHSIMDEMNRSGGVAAIRRSEPAAKRNHASRSAMTETDGTGESVRCGVCRSERISRDFPKLYLAEIPGYPLGATRRTLARVLICRPCLSQMRDPSRGDARLRRLIRWTR